MLDSPTRPAAEATPSHGCPRCGAAAEHGQLACLACGHPVGLRWRRPSSWKGPVAVAGLLVVLAGVAAGLGLSTLTVDPPLTVTVPSTQPPPPPPGELAASEGPAPPGEAASEAETWPPGERGYTVVLSTSRDEGAARAEAGRAAERGIDEVGVLNGRDHSELDPNLFVVFAGRYDTSREARQDADDYASQGYGDAYARLIAPAG